MNFTDTLSCDSALAITAATPQFSLLTRLLDVAPAMGIMGCQRAVRIFAGLVISAPAQFISEQGFLAVVVDRFAEQIGVGFLDHRQYELIFPRLTTPPYADIFVGFDRLLLGDAILKVSERIVHLSADEVTVVSIVLLSNIPPSLFLNDA